MKSPLKKEKTKKELEDDTLFGLLSSYKAYNSYFRILISEEKDSIVVQIADNPQKWLHLMKEKYKDYRVLKRSDIGTVKLSVKYLSPKHIFMQMEDMLGPMLLQGKITIINNIDKQGYFILETTLILMSEIVQFINKIINLTPKKKYELLEQFLAEDSL